MSGPTPPAAPEPQGTPDPRDTPDPQGPDTSPGPRASRNPIKDGSVGVGRILGVEIRLHPSWFIIFVLLIFWLGAAPDQAEEVPGLLRWGVAVVVALLFFGSVVVHELAHALVARRRGLRVDTITLFIFGGAANLEQEAPTPATEALVAGAGPVANLVLAIIFWLPFLATRSSPDPTGEMIAGVCFYLAASNLLLGLFNLVPGFPMDGGRLFRALIWWRTHDFVRATRWAALVGRGFAWLLIGVGFVLAVVSDVVNGIWLAFIGWFLNQAAEASYKRIEVEQVVAGVNVGDVMEREWPSLPAQLTLDTFVDQVAMAQGPGFYVVTQGDELIGTLDVGQVSRVPRGQWQEKRIGDVMTSGDAIVTLLAADPLWNAVMRFEEGGAHGIPVVSPADRRRLVGLLTRDGVFRALRARSQAAPGPGGSGPAGATGAV
ncbi:MAG TPA: site-2 protease family protein [Candidatus Limnocylindrales bacterium]|nr:site-2 protease family protein [Candidatus Limnocylindrales bacterium]